MKRILYIQHAGALGGSAISLLNLIRGLDRSRFEPIVACIHPATDILQMYEQAGIDALYWPNIDDFMHTTGGWYPLYSPLDIPKLIRRLTHWRASVEATVQLIEHVKPDIVHLNSLVLPLCAIAAKKQGVKLVWHIRESVVRGHFGLRKRWLGHLVTKLADEAIFLSHDGRRLLINDKVGTVIPNWVDFRIFDNDTTDEMCVRRELNIGQNAKVILFLGGRSIIKGIFPLLDAMPLIKSQVPDVHLLIGSGAYHPSGRLISKVARTLLPWIGYGTVAQRVDRVIEHYHLQNYIHLLEWRSDIPQLLANSNLLVFPSVEPHFARPVIEAGAMRKPVVASRIGGVEELVENGKTGILVPPNDVMALANAVSQLLQDSDLSQKMGIAAHKRARSLFSSDKNVMDTIRVYEKLFL